MKKILIFLIGFYIGVIVFIPKDNIYFTIQKYLSKEKIYINSNIKSNILDLSLNNSIVYYNGMDLIRFKSIKAFLFLFFNEIKANKIKLNLGNYIIYHLRLIYYIFNPTNILIKGDSNFGKIDGKIDLLKRYVKVYIKLTNNNLKAFLRKDKKGYYYYAKF